MLSYPRQKLGFLQGRQQFLLQPVTMSHPHCPLCQHRATVSKQGAGDVPQREGCAAATLQTWGLNKGL